MLAGTNHERLDAGIENSTKTHGAGFACGIKNAIGKRALAQFLCCGFDGERLRMSGRIEGANLQTSRLADHLVAARNHGTERLLAGSGTELGFLDGHRHEPLMIVHDAASPQSFVRGSTTPEKRTPRKVYKPGSVRCGLVAATDAIGGFQALGDSYRARTNSGSAIPPTCKRW